MNLVSSVPRSADAPLLSDVSFAMGTPRQADTAAATTEPVTPAFLVSLATLVAQVEQGPDPVRPALELSRLTVTRMAEELGIPRATLAAYRLGTRRMPASNRARLGHYLAAHADALARVARALCGDTHPPAHPASAPHAPLVREPGEAGTPT